MAHTARKLIILATVTAAVATLFAACGTSNTGDDQASPGATQPGTSSATTLPSTASAASPRYSGCSGGQLRAVWAQGSAYAGGYGDTYLLTDVSKSNCSLYGFPNVTGVRADGTRQQLYFPPASVVSGTVDLQPGESAQLELTFPACAMRPPEVRTPITASDNFASAVLVPPGGGDVSLPPGTGAVVSHSIPPDWGVNYTCPGGGPRPFMQPDVQAPTATP